MLATFGKMIRDDEGATAIEYGLVSLMVSVALIALFQTIGDALVAIFTNVSNALG